MILVEITCRDRAEAERIADNLLKKRIIACANFFPIESLYWWSGKITSDNEHMVLCKTMEDRFEELCMEVKKTHSYEVPCIIKVSAEADPEYDKWVRREVKS